MARLAGAQPDPGLPRIVIAGGSGSLGRLLAARLFGLGHEVRIITRRRDPRLPFEQVVWDGRTVGDWAEVLHSQDEAGVALVNLAGKLVDVRPSAANIAELRSSRVDSTRALVAASQRLERPLVSWLQASTTAIWSDAHEQRVTETTPVLEPGLPQMTGVARPWEEATQGANCEHLVLLRTSIVLDRGAPALQILARLTRAGLGGRVGSGYQWFSWVHHEDWLRMAVAALGLDPRVHIPDGPLIAAAPGPVRNADLMAALRRHLHRPAAPSTPAALLHLGAIGLRSDPALALTGRHCTSAVLREAGFEFAYPDIDAALTQIYG
ncbi:NAD-dependent dehydratase [Janibacter sp. Soil728]|nr:NAD-dependent dehydratase [Janibacter sp. Soil728]